MVSLSKIITSEGVRQSGPRWALSCLIVIVFLVGGGSRWDIASLVYLRPASAILLGYALVGTTSEQVRANRFVVGMAAAIVVLILIQLIPVPPSLWSKLPGRELVVEIDRAAGLGAVWRPLNLVPWRGWNAFYSLLPLLATIALAVRMSFTEMMKLIPLLLAIGILSVVIGVLQINGPIDGPLYFYEVTTRGGAVGLFANRNHHAAFLAVILLLLPVYISRHMPSRLDVRLRAIVALTLAILFLGMVLATQSRAGIVLAMLSLLACGRIHSICSFEVAGVSHSRWRRLAILGGLLLIVATLILSFERDSGLDRLVSQQVAIDPRLRAWGPIVEMIWKYFPIGSGFGTFVEVFRVHEPHALLGFLTFNHAHNDWLEVALTGGLPAILLLGYGVAAFIGHTLIMRPMRQDRPMTLAGAGVVVLLALASLADYPLRVPSLGCLFCIGWVCSMRRSTIRKAESD